MIVVIFVSVVAGFVTEFALLPVEPKHAISTRCTLTVVEATVVVIIVSVVASFKVNAVVGEVAAGDAVATSGQLTVGSTGIGDILVAVVTGLRRPGLEQTVSADALDGLGLPIASEVDGHLTAGHHEEQAMPETHVSLLALGNHSLALRASRWVRNC